MCTALYCWQFWELCGSVHESQCGPWESSAGYRQQASGKEKHTVSRETWLLLWGARACLISRAAPFTEQVQLGSCWRLSNRKLRNKVTQATTYVTADGETCPKSLILLLSCFLCRSLHLGKHTCNTQMSTMYKHMFIGV